MGKWSQLNWDGDNFLCRMLLIPKIDSMIRHRDKDTLFASYLPHKLPFIRLSAYIIYFTLVNKCLTELLCTSTTLNQPISKPKQHSLWYSFTIYTYVCIVTANISGYTVKGTFKRQFYSACSCVARCQYIVGNLSQHMS